MGKPTHEATIQEGEALVFFPCQFHETFVPPENPECTVATTFQFQHPLPVTFFRAFLPTLTNSHLYYEQHCKDLWHFLGRIDGLATKGQQGDEPLKLSIKRWKSSLDESVLSS